MEDRAARQPGGHARVLRLRRLRGVRARHRRGDLPQYHADRVAHGVVRRVRGRLSGPADRRNRPQPLRRPLRAAHRVPAVALRHVGGHAGDGAGAVLRRVGRVGQLHHGDAAAGAGLLHRRRAARRAHLRGRDRAEACAVRLRAGLRVRHDGRGGRLGCQPGRAHVAGAGAGADLRLADRVRARWPGRPPQLPDAPGDGGVAGVRAHEGAGLEAAVR